MTQSNTFVKISSTSQQFTLKLIIKHDSLKHNPLFYFVCAWLIKTTFKQSSAQVVYDTNIRLPYDLINSETVNQLLTLTCVTELIKTMLANPEIYVIPHCKPVLMCFLKPDKMNFPLSPSYTQPYLVIDRSNKKKYVYSVHNMYLLIYFS